MEKGFDLKIDEDVVDDGWGRHRADDEVFITIFNSVCFHMIGYMLCTNCLGRTRR